MENLDLDVIDYLQTGVTERRCMRILPNNDKRRVTQKVVVGDKTGTLQCFGVKKREINSIFKLLPGPPISRVELGGALGTPQDKIFVASGSEVHGYSRKGKKFLDFNSNLTDTISNMCISGSELLVTGSYIFNHFSDCVDQGFYSSSDKINDVICLPPNRKQGEKLTPVLACNDRVLRVLEGSELSVEVEVSGSPQCITSYKDGDDNEDGYALVYGTNDGKLGHVLLTGDQPIYNWEISNDKSTGGVSCLAHHDITGDGVKDLLVGRSDGRVEIYSYDVSDEPVLRFSHSFNESITSIQGGVVGSLGFDEVLVSTYSGWISGLTTEHLQKKASGTNLSNQPSVATSSTSIDLDTSNKLDLLRAEVENIQRKVKGEQDKHFDRTAKLAASNIGALTQASTFHVNDKFVLSPADASYHLTIEVQTAIDHVILQSDVPVDLLDVDKTTAVISYTNTQTSPNSNPNSNGNFLLATYRCQPNTSRLEVKIRSIEGQHGHLQAYVAPRLHPKTAVLRRYPIRPLSLHQRTHNIDDRRPMNELTLSGPFSIAEMHSWISFCLPDLPERPPVGETVTFCFVNTFLETQLECTYRKGEGAFRSDNISTISILKDILSKEATAKKIALNIRYQVDENSIPHTLHLLHPKLEHQLMLAKKVQLLDALQELQTHEGNLDFLAPEYQQILESSAELKSEYEKQPARLERLYGMITDLYIDKYKFKGVNVKQKVPQLLETLDNYELQNLINFFSQPVY